MFIPWGTDAPIYHRPFATLGVAVASVLCFFAFPARSNEGLMLALGQGLHPFQWLTNIFMHAGLGHLFGNMLFLWAFGIIVEGKIGPFAFLAVYVLIGVAESAIVQIAFLRGDEGHMLGASGAIYGLMAICMVWAPRNELHCIWFWRFIPSEVDLSILWFVVLYVALDVFWASVRGFRPSGELAHVIGASVGFAVGSIMVKMDLVDCEGWDLFAVMGGRQGEKKGARTPAKPSQRKARELARSIAPASTPRRSRRVPVPVSGPPSPEANERRLKLFREHLDLGELEAALKVYRTGKERGWTPPRNEHRDLIRALLKTEDWPSTVAVMKEYLGDDPAAEPRVALKLAEILSERMARPVQAIRILERLDESALPEELRAIRRHLLADAEHRRDDEDGVLELQDEVG